MSSESKIIGVVKERKDGECRVALVPSDVSVLINAGHSVNIEKGAGIGAGFSDEDYVNAHPKVKILSTRQLYKQSNFIVKVKEPVDFDLKYLTSQHKLFCYLHLAPNPQLTETLCERKIDSYAFESIRDVHGYYPLLVPMSTIAGQLAIQFAAEHLRKNDKMSMGKLLGINTNVVVAGCGTSGAAAGQLATKLGCKVSVADIKQDAMLRVPYANRSYNISNPTELQDFYSIAIPSCDVFVGAVLVPNKKSPIILTREHVQTMRKGSIIVDIAIDQGGCVEDSPITSHSKPIEWIDGVGHICIPNMPGCVPTTASTLISTWVADYIVRGKYTDGVNIENGELKI